ncbi:MAG: L,D-transpeptidase family protein [Nocardiopsaceae bacterium]|nr:L,D-transpeptidase family protein [Nocardiopsaceae bacterium]
MGIGKRLAALAAVVALALAVSACSGGSTTVKSAGNSNGHGSAASPSPSSASGDVKITPADGSRDANPSKGIAVTTTHGTLTGVTVKTSGGKGGKVSGSYSRGKSAWHSAWALGVSQSYTVTATASVNGQPVTRTSSFRTLSPSSTFSTEIINGYHQTYGVGMPILLYFSKKITDRAAVERSLQVTTSKPVIGAWYWDNSCGTAPTCAYFRPRDYWPAGTKVSFTGHLDGVEGAPGVYGYHTLTQTFTIGQSVVAVGSTASHHTQIYVDGKQRYDWPISTGRPGDDTPDGSYLTIEKENPVRMTGPGYSLEVPWSVRFTWSGDYYHDAYWSTSEQGYTNVSHGCVNLSPTDAEIYYKLAVPGDPITIQGSPQSGTWDNGWTMWFKSWKDYLKGSALGEAVKAGPHGSTFVNPSTLPPDTAKAPLHTSPANNAAAS